MMIIRQSTEMDVIFVNFKDKKVFKKGFERILQRTTMGLELTDSYPKFQIVLTVIVGTAKMSKDKKSVLPKHQ